VAQQTEQPDPMSTPIGAPARGADGGRSNIEPRLPYDDLRQWLDEARRLGEVKEVSGLNWQRDIGMVAGVALHDDDAPCFVFDQIPGTIEGSRVLINFFGGKRKNMTLGFPTDLSKIELSEGFRTNFMAEMARAGRRPLYRHRQLQCYSRPGRGLDQLRHLSGDDPRRQDRRFLHLTRQAWPPNARQVSGAQ